MNGTHVNDRVTAERVAAATAKLGRRLLSACWLNDCGCCALTMVLAAEGVIDLADRPDDVVIQVAAEERWGEDYVQGFLSGYDPGWNSDFYPGSLEAFDVGQEDGRICSDTLRPLVVPNE